MAFWSGETLTRRLGPLITTFDARNIKYASYELAVGAQAFVTKDDLVGSDPSAALTQMLQDLPPQNTVVIRPGQFAFILTEEFVKVPKNALALISMKAGLKFRGLINVSGFHVDPGFEGHLLFAIYNAGPREVILNRGQKVFIIVYADLDQLSTPPYVYSGLSQGQNAIKTELIESIATGQVFSPMRLAAEMEAIRSEITSVRTRASLIDGVVMASIGIFISIVLGVGAALFGSDTAVATLGFWIKNAIAEYDETQKKN
jgi:dCTP deaminase